MSAMTQTYNFSHFERRHIKEDLDRTRRGAGVRPGEVAPDFVLPLVGDGEFRLSHHADRPLLLRFGSYS